MAETIEVKKQEELNQIETINDDFFVLQLLLEERLEARIQTLFKEAKEATLTTFRDQFVPNYTREKEAWVELRKELNHFDWWPVKDYKRIGWYQFEFCKIPFKLRRKIEKASGNVPEEIIAAVSEINPDPFADALTEGAFRAHQAGGESSFAIYGIDLPFNLRDANVEAYIQNYELSLAEAISGQISSTIRFELLEGVRAGESIPQIAARIGRAYDKPITVSVPPKLAPDGTVVRAGYSYALSNEAWATTVARSETARGFIEGKLEGYRQTAVVTTVEFVVTPDERLCPACGALEGSVYKLENANGIIPVHANCRCTFIPHTEITQAVRDQARANVEGLEE